MRPCIVQREQHQQYVFRLPPSSRRSSSPPITGLGTPEPNQLVAALSVSPMALMSKRTPALVIDQDLRHRAESMF